MKNSMKATSVRKLLTALIVLLILAAAGGFYYGVQQVKSLATEVNHTTADAAASDTNVQKLQELKQSLAQSETLVNKANKLFSTNDNYQSQSLKDVQKYASSFGLTISNTNFEPQVNETGAAPTTGTTFAITLQAPVSYKSLLQFLDAIEGNLPKMQIASITLNRPTSAGADGVIVGDINLTVATR